MSVRAYEAVWDSANVKGGSLLVLLAIADHADRDTGVAWPSVSTLASMTRLGRRQVGRILEELDVGGLLDRWHYRDGSRWRSLYRVTVGVFAEFRGQSPLEGAVPGPPPTNPSRRQDVASAEATSATVQGDISDASEATSASVAPLVENHQLNRHGTPGMVDKKPVTDEESEIALAVLVSWNEQAGTAFTPSAWLGKIIMRCRENPQLDVEAHAGVIRHALAHPWWQGAASPSVVYGSAAQFERSLIAANTQPRRKEAYDDLDEL